VALVVLAAPAARGDEALWALLRGGGHVSMLRHATTTPGVGDPPGFRLDDCATQRNLGAEGREEARLAGTAFRARGIPVGRVLSSEWCRCLETARLAFGRAEPWRPLNNLHGNRAAEPAAVRAIRELTRQRHRDGNLVLVTHGSVVLPVTGIHPAQGEIVVLAPDGGSLRIVGRLSPDAIRRAAGG